MSFHSRAQTIGKRKSVHSYVVILLFLILVGVGLVNLYSASMGGGYFFSQLRHMLICFGAFLFFGWVMPIRHLNTYAYYIFAVFCILLLAVLVLGHTAGGSQRWLTLGPMRLQPSEFAKIAVAITVARFFYTNRSSRDYELKDLWILFLMVGAVFGLIFKQPDLGTAGVCLLIAAAQLMFVRINLRSIGIVLMSGVAVALVGWKFLLMDYQKLRILNLFNPGLDPYGSGYNSRQSLVAVGSGSFFGKGFLEGTQTQLQFLPARHTDFVFSVFAEEHGFWACLVVFVLFGVLAYVGFEIARNSKNTFNALLAIGLAVLLFFEFVINVAMVLGVFPVVGMPLPFFSYGGSALLTVCIAAGLLISIDRESAGLSKQNKINPVKVG